jgi:hypothetical protein
MYFSLPTTCYNGDHLAEIPTTALRVYTHQQSLRLYGGEHPERDIPHASKVNTCKLHNHIEGEHQENISLHPGRASLRKCVALLSVKPEETLRGTFYVSASVRESADLCLLTKFSLTGNVLLADYEPTTRTHWLHQHLSPPPPRDLPELLVTRMELQYPNHKGSVQ